jgi:hypothetical protein
MGNGIIKTDHTHEFKSLFYKNTVKAFIYYKTFHNEIVLDPLNFIFINQIFSQACYDGNDDIATLIYNKYNVEVTQIINYNVIYHPMKQLFNSFLFIKPPKCRSVILTDEKTFPRVIKNLSLIQGLTHFYEFEILTKLKFKMKSRADIDFLISMSQNNQNIFKKIYIDHKQMLRNFVIIQDWKYVLNYLNIYLSDETVIILIEPSYEDIKNLIDTIKDTNNNMLLNKLDFILNKKLSEQMYKFILNFIIYDD